MEGREVDPGAPLTLLQKIRELAVEAEVADVEALLTLQPLCLLDREHRLPRAGAAAHCHPPVEAEPAQQHALVVRELDELLLFLEEALGKRNLDLDFGREALAQHLAASIARRL